MVMQRKHTRLGGIATVYQQCVVIIGNCSRKNKSPPLPRAGAVVTNDWCIRRCRAQPNNEVSVNISDEQPTQTIILNIITCCTCYKRDVELTTEIYYVSFYHKRLENKVRNLILAKYD